MNSAHAHSAPFTYSAVGAGAVGGKLTRSEFSSMDVMDLLAMNAKDTETQL